MSSHHGQEPLNSSIRSGTGGTTSKSLPPATASSRLRLPIKRARMDSDSENSNNGEADMDKMDFEQTQHMTATQALGGTDDIPEFSSPQLPLPLTPEHAAIRADIEAITASAMEQLYRRITTDINASVTGNTAAFLRTSSELRQQITMLNGRVTQMQQQLLVYQNASQPPAATTATAPAKKILKKTLGKKNTSEDSTRTTTNTGGIAVPAPPSEKETPATNTRGWETVKSGGQQKKATPPKLIPTIYPQAEREVMCHFLGENINNSIELLEESNHIGRQATADVALRRVNSALVDNKDVMVPPFIRARVTRRGSIIFTTGNMQNNVIYEDYATIIIDALSYYGKCEKVEIGKRFSQFLLHGVPTHLSIPEIAHSIATNYPQLVQGQTLRWLTSADRRGEKTNSTIVMTLTGDIKKASIGLQYLIICNRECQLDEYISYGRSTQCHHCQAYGHPAALCRKTPRCAICAEPHETKSHPCNLPIAKKALPAHTLQFAAPTATHHIRPATPTAQNESSCEPARMTTSTTTTNKGDAPMAGVAN